MRRVGEESFVNAIPGVLNLADITGTSGEVANLTNDSCDGRRDQLVPLPALPPLAAARRSEAVVPPRVEIQVAAIHAVQIDKRAHHAREIPEFRRAPRMVGGAEKRQAMRLHVREAVHDPVPADNEKIGIEDE